MRTEKLNSFENKWNSSEIKKAGAIFEKINQHDLFASKLVFASALIVIIFANLIVSLILIPFLIVLNKLILYFIIIILGGTIGFLYNFLINDINHLEKKHHLLAGIIIPLLALANLMIMVLISNRFISELNINNQQHNPLMIAIVFTIAFILPYIIDSIRIHFKKRKAVILNP